MESGVIRQGYDFNVEPFVAKGSMPSFEAVRISRKNVLLETMKPAEDGSGDLVLRLYEAAGAAVEAEVTVDLTVREAYECNMLEEKKRRLWETEGETPSLRLSFRAFEIKTLRLCR